jgi:hypothetical protein
MELGISPRTTFPLARISGDIEGSAWTLHLFPVNNRRSHRGSLCWAIVLHVLTAGNKMPYVTPQSRLPVHGLIFRGTRCPNNMDVWSTLHWRLGPCPHRVLTVQLILHPRTRTVSPTLPGLVLPVRALPRFHSTYVDARRSLSRTFHSHKMSRDTRTAAPVDILTDRSTSLPGIYTVSHCRGA